MTPMRWPVPIGIQWVFDDYLKPNEAHEDMNGLWHIGSGTDMDAFVFNLNLTDFDKRLLSQCKVSPE